MIAQTGERELGPSILAKLILNRDMNGNLYQPGTIGWNRYHRMKRLADDDFGIIWNLAADLDFHASFHRAPRSTSATPCWCCPVGQRDSALPFNDFRVAPVPAPWMNQILNILCFLANPSAHPLLNCGPVTMLTLTLAWMHCKYLGSDKLLLRRCVPCYNLQAAFRDCSTKHGADMEPFETKFTAL